MRTIKEMLADLWPMYLIIIGAWVLLVLYNAYLA